MIDRATALRATIGQRRDATVVTDLGADDAPVTTDLAARAEHPDRSGTAPARLDQARRVAAITGREAPVVAALPRVASPVAAARGAHAVGRARGIERAAPADLDPTRTRAPISVIGIAIVAGFDRRREEPVAAARAAARVGHARAAATARLALADPTVLDATIGRAPVAPGGVTVVAGLASEREAPVAALGGAMVRRAGRAEAAPAVLDGAARRAPVGRRGVAVIAALAPVDRAIATAAHADHERRRLPWIGRSSRTSEVAVGDARGERPLRWAVASGGDRDLERDDARRAGGEVAERHPREQVGLGANRPGERGRAIDEEALGHVGDAVGEPFGQDEANVGRAGVAHLGEARGEGDAIAGQRDRRARREHRAAVVEERAAVREGHARREEVVRVIGRGAAKGRARPVAREQGGAVEVDQIPALARPDEQRLGSVVGVAEGAAAIERAVRRGEVTAEDVAARGDRAAQACAVVVEIAGGARQAEGVAREIGVALHRGERGASGAATAVLGDAEAIEGGRDGRGIGAGDDALAEEHEGDARERQGLLAVGHIEGPAGGGFAAERRGHAADAVRAGPLDERGDVGRARVVPGRGHRPVARARGRGIGGDEVEVARGGDEAHGAVGEPEHRGAQGPAPHELGVGDARAGGQVEHGRRGGERPVIGRAERPALELQGEIGIDEGAGAAERRGPERVAGEPERVAGRRERDAPGGLEAHARRGDGV